MSEPSANSFVSLLERSGVVDPDRLKPAIAALKKKAKAAGKEVTTSRLVKYLIESELITQWQADKFLAGKYKGFFLGKFKLLRHLGSGGMSSVYLARHKISDQLRAIKVLPRKKVADKSYLDRFYLEARIAASLNHPNVVRIYDICEENGVHFMVMEYAKGEDLLELVTRDGPLKFTDAAKYVAEACEGLKHAHNKDLVHRDIKPANLLLGEDQSVKLLDLGLALVNQDNDESLTVLYNEKVMGTADYLAPEQAVNSHAVDLRADIYSLGCTLYFLLVGHPPFPKGSLAQRIAKHQSTQPPCLSTLREDVPAQLREIVEAMMCKDPDKRMQTCNDVQVALENFLATDGIPETVTLIEQPDSDEGSAASGKKSPASDSVNTPLQSLEIDTSRKKRKPKSTTTVSKKKHSQKVAKPPAWVLPAIVGGMILALAAMLAIVLYLTN